MGISGPSFLGLNSGAGTPGFTYDQPRSDGFIYDSPSETPEYLLEEAPAGSSWRTWALFALFVIVAGLGYVQWRASHHEAPDIASLLAGNGATLDPNHPVIDDKNAKPPAPQQGAAERGAVADTSSSSGEQKTETNSTPESDHEADSDSSDSAATSNTAVSQQTGRSATDNSDKNGATGDSDADDSSAQGNEARQDRNNADRHPIHKSVANAPRKEEPQPKPLGDKDPLIIQADRYIHGRGVQQNCSTGVNLLRQSVSAGNPEASVKLGALYWSGTCVTQSNVTAYQWFARAHSLDPGNRWIERSRNSLWASMSPQDRQRVGY
jgi:hypothetical protein